MPPTEAELKKDAEERERIVHPGARSTPPTEASKQPAKQKPSICRWVVYNHPPVRVSHHSGVEGKISIEKSPALVQHVNPDGTLRLHVHGPHTLFGPTGIELVPSAAEAQPNALDQPGTWHWPERV